MKTAMIFAFATMVLSFNAFAETPYARTCRIAGGQQWAVDMISKQDTVLCVFGDAAVGAAEFANYKWDNSLSLSLVTFLQQKSQLGLQGVCETFGAYQMNAKDSDGRTWSLCQFKDGTIVEAQTLARGVNDPANASLVKALQ